MEIGERIYKCIFEILVMVKLEGLTEEEIERIENKRKANEESEKYGQLKKGL